MLPMKGHPGGPGGSRSLEDRFLSLDQKKRATRKERVNQVEVSEKSHAIFELVLSIQSGESSLVIRVRDNSLEMDTTCIIDFTLWMLWFTFYAY